MNPDSDNKAGRPRHPGLPPAAPLEQGFEKVITPFQAFIRDQTVASLLLIICTLLALLIANSSLGHDFERLLETPAGFVLGEQRFAMSLRHWINDALMALFFFVIGLEIKREVLVGELRDTRRSVPVIAAATGGMILPAAIYAAINFNTPELHGWGVPMATDTAFAVGILALLGARAPAGLAAFLTALAIIDDLGAIAVIALFYTETISGYHLVAAAVLFATLALCNLAGIRAAPVYLFGGALVWLAMQGSGIHATVAGILVALAVPARPKRSASWVLRRMQGLTREFESLNRAQPAKPVLAADEHHELVEQVQQTAEKATTPLQRWMRGLEHPVALFVLPVFALANAGVVLEPDTLPAMLADPVTLGIVLGLTLGKTVGITGFCWLALRFGAGRLPGALTMRHVLGVGMLGGVGFTMSVFIAGLGFGSAPETLNHAKSGILLASLLAGTGGYLWLRAVARRHPGNGT